jgi:hypothetical protein
MCPLARGGLMHVVGIVVLVVAVTLLGLYIWGWEW